MKLINSKKAIGVDDLFPLLFAVVAFVVIILLFTYSHSKEANAINEDVSKVKGEIESYNLLHTFLAQEISFDLNRGYSNAPPEVKELSMADFIKYYYLEKDQLNKKAHYSRILTEMQYMFDPLEYCFINPNGVKVKRTYYIFMTKDLDESTEWEEKVKDRIFRSQSVGLLGLYNTLIIYPLPLPDSRVLYIKFFLGYDIAKKSCPIRK